MPGIEVIPYDASPSFHELDTLARKLEAGHLDVPIAGEYPLGEPAKAHKRLVAGQVMGKLVLRVRI